MSKVQMSLEIFQGFEFLGIPAEKFLELKKEHGGTMQSLHNWVAEQLS